MVLNLNSISTATNSHLVILSQQRLYINKHTSAVCVDVCNRFLYSLANIGFNMREEIYLISTGIKLKFLFLEIKLGYSLNLKKDL